MLRSMELPMNLLWHNDRQGKTKNCSEDNLTPACAGSVEVSAGLRRLKSQRAAQDPDLRSRGIGEVAARKSGAEPDVCMPDLP
jgi:hypothetical protein